MSRYYRSLIQTVSFDADALAFLTAASITDPTITTAIEALVIDLKAAGIWTKMKAVYPFVGATASSHKWNLKDPRDLDAAFRLTFMGGVTHNSGGVTPNGTSGYALTYVSRLNHLQLNSVHLSFYSRSNQSLGTLVDMGVGDGISRCYIGIRRNYGGVLNRSVSDITSASNTIPTAAILESDTTSANYYIASRESASLNTLYKGGAQVAQNTTDWGITSANNNTVFLFAANNQGSATSFSPRSCGLASIGDGLTSTEAANLYNAVQAFQITLGRAV
jgi:hypothetical protein